MRTEPCGFCEEPTRKACLTYGLGGPYFFPLCDEHSKDNNMMYPLEQADKMIEAWAKESEVSDG